MEQSKVWVWAGALVFVSLIWGAPELARASDVIEFPQEELAAESVLPVFDNPESVKNRSVVTAKRIEIGALGGYSLTEPFFNTSSYGVTASYHFNEEHGLNLFANFFMPGLNDYGKQLNPIPNTAGINANLQYAPAPKYLMLGSYQHTGYYGKLSITKDYVMNLSVYGLAGLGMIGIGDATKPVGSLGIGQKLYLTPSIALRFDFRILMYQGPDPISRPLDQVTKEQPANFFDEKLNIQSLVSFGAIFMLPQM